MGSIKGSPLSLVPPPHLNDLIHSIRKFKGQVLILTRTGPYPKQEFLLKRSHHLIDKT